MAGVTLFKKGDVMRYLIVLLLAGCASQQPRYEWVRAGSTGNFDMEYGQCQAQAYGVRAPTEQQLRLFLGCMRGKGWRVEQR